MIKLIPNEFPILSISSGSEIALEGSGHRQIQPSTDIHYACLEKGIEEGEEDKFILTTNSWAQGRTLLNEQHMVFTKTEFKKFLRTLKRQAKRLA